MLVDENGVLALDARIRIAPAVGSERLAIRPYPSELEETIAVRAGRLLVMRPIRPEDEPLWHNLIASSSPESIRFRFRSIFKRSNHEMAVRHCMIDYARELALVVETGSGSQRELIGVAQLMTDLNQDTAPATRILIGREGAIGDDDPAIVGYQFDFPLAPLQFRVPVD